MKVQSILQLSKSRSFFPPVPSKKKEQRSELWPRARLREIFPPFDLQRSRGIPRSRDPLIGSSSWNIHEHWNEPEVVSKPESGSSRGQGCLELRPELSSVLPIEIVEFTSRDNALLAQMPARLDKCQLMYSHNPALF